MKQARLVCASLAVALAGTLSVSAFACDHDKNTKATAAASSKTCTAQMAAACTPEMAAACKAKGVSASAAAACCEGHKGAAATAANAGSCAAHQSAAMTAANAGSCPAHQSAAVMAANAGSCAGHKTSAMASGTGQCSGQGMSTMAGKNGHGDCDACADMAMCESELGVIGATTQVVQLRNGLMFVYTAGSPGNVNAVQSAMARRSERMAQFMAAGDKARLCAECKAMRGAMASGKLTREVINIEGGALTLMTSDDPKIVAKIHAMVDTKTAVRTKS